MAKVAPAALADVLPCLAGLVVTTPLVHAAALDDLQKMSLQELSDVAVTSVSKSAEPLRQAPATVFVITHSDIVRSGATSIPEILRLAPNLRITQLSSSSYSISARGFGGNSAAQNFSNKILMLIDGRSVYSPLFSGIYLDVQEVNIADIDRIEVISGAGATLWGANAMNGVINIITRTAFQTSGTAIAAGAGNYEKDLSARYGQQLGSDGALRVYGKAFTRGSLDTAEGASAQDGWNKLQGGFRGDWSQGPDDLTAQADLYRATEDEPGTAELGLGGGDVLSRWQHHFSRSDLTVQAYLDQTQRESAAGDGGFVVHTYDLQAQQNALIGDGNRLIWGAGERLTRYEIANAQALLFVPSQRNQSLANVFLQDSATLTGSLAVTLGVKGEDDPYSGWALLPDARLSWSPRPTELLWASASRAIRSPTPFDVDVVEKSGAVTFLTGNPSFLPERVLAYEAGYRGEPSSAVSMSASIFYDVYDDLRTIEPASASVFLPLHWGNLMTARTLGLEAWADWQVTDRWRVSPGIEWLHEDLQFMAGASGLLGTAQAGDDPTHQALLRSSLDFGKALSLDTTLRYVGRLPNAALPSYVELNARLGWQVSRSLDISVTGSNLLHARHLEYPAPYGEEVPRTVYAEARWTF